MRVQSKLFILMLITSVTGFAQRHSVINKSFEVNKGTTAIFNIDYTAVAIEESTDGKIHFNYTLEFEGYSKKKIQKKIEDLNVEVSNSENHITLNVNVKSFLPKVDIEYNDKGGHVFYKYKEKTEADSVVQKSKDSLIRFINTRNRVYKSPLKFINNKFKKITKDGKYIDVKGSNMIRSQFVIKIPPYVKLTINGKQSKFFFRNDLRNELSIDLKGGYIRAKKLLNEYNNVKIKNGDFEATAITGGNYMFNKIGKSYIGSVQNTKFSTEFSDIEIGEIGENVTITDFNSEYYFYNWAKNFKRFNVYSEYSKIHFFYPKDDHSFKVFGNNTKNFVGKYEINMQPTKKGEKYNMMERKPKGQGHFAGEIFFDIIHGIIYSHNDSIIKINK
ncbi:hypothetical protein GCM10011444_14000 [Winogradskyella haliclonae]|uniref:Adhesin domain-containing protein n=2 Tax=Winogradskyella haliclonae TaxID=2048558 RepID=A0ABQ2BYU3_9FLAO|nr:hypothetical protein GCM10011444_14000 [Winogradskyella haliclonae]